ncbi:TetR/AcrR family transcriptional regulator [Allosphingosinicella indica]|uniref:Transcriptional regulator, TetR family n=1 Tax=Allosphingosinicella indica TaxID=941907 RepID=A0A1X7FYJ1_9SPHN|nr:TetR/AcrR family transcriptional regulator [Allosphingosinicella indica]SMF61159.1 transcriptional regulator, TetR family [Allosphingosinicella indica]
MASKQTKTRSAADKDEQATPLEADWIAAARTMLIEGGVAAVQINPLAQRLGVTRGGFYWRFRNRQDLLDHLLADWQNSNTRHFLLALQRSGTPQERYRRMVRMFIEEREFDPALDAAIRQWGGIDPAIADKVREADDQRIDALRRVFLDAGQEEDEAMIRARIVYFHQIGYYALGIRETRERRRTLAPLYDRILCGF